MSRAGPNYPTPLHFDYSDDSRYPPEHSPYLDAHMPTTYPMVQKPSWTSDTSDRSTVTDISSNMPLSVPLPADREPGFWQNIFPSSMACRFYLLVVLLETIVDLVIEADILVLLNRTLPEADTDLKLKRLPVYLAVFALAHLFQLLLALDAVHARNTLQFIFLTIFNALLLLYSIVQKSEIVASIPSNTTGISHIPVNILTTIIAMVIGVAEVAYIGLGWKIYIEFGWKVYKLLGADRTVKRMYMHYQIFVCLVKFDVFFWIGFSVQWIFLVLKNNDIEWYITVAALPISLALLIVGHAAARHENRWLMALFLSGCGTGFCYFVYKLYRILRSRDDPDFRPVFKTLTVFSSVAVILLVITFGWACHVMRNFDAGLKFHMSKNRKGAPSISLGRSGTMLRQERHTSHFEMAPSSHRMSID